MLIDFKIENYKSFLTSADFSMTAAPKQSGLDYSLCKERIKHKVIKGLCSSVIYGPNAAGKTNIIGAMDTLRSIVLRGNIQNAGEQTTPNAAATSLELIPNNHITNSIPLKMEVAFVENSIKFEYALSMDLGKFLDVSYDRKLLFESLKINDSMVFERRNNEILFGNLSKIENYLLTNSKQTDDSIKQISQNSLNETELFLTNGFKLIFSKELVQLIINWFTNKFMIIYRADSVQYIKRFNDPQKNSIYVEKTIDKAAKAFGINSNAVGYVVSDNDNETKLCSLFNKENGKSTALQAEIFESYGTIRFINIFPLVMRAIKTGATLVVDEFDASIHPMALMSIINVFHNNDINVNNAQIIFNTHNPIFLNSNIFRRDEIKFVECGDDHFSKIYSLSDFGTSGKNGVRKHEDYLKNYFISRYGAIKDIDFTPIFEEMIKGDVN